MSDDQDNEQAAKRQQRDARHAEMLQRVRERLEEHKRAHDDRAAESDEAK